MQIIPPDPSPFLEVAIGVLSLVFIIIVHGVGIRIIERRFSLAWARMRVEAPRWRENVVLAFVIGALASLHMFETLLIALPLQFSGAFSGLRDSYYYVMECYTTLGEGNLALPNEWRLLGPIISMAGLFTFGWTGSVLVSIMTQFGQRDSARANLGLKRASEADRRDAGP